MRRFIAFLVVLSFVVSSSAAFAQSNGDTKTQFVEFDEYLVKADPDSPSILVFKKDDRANFDKLRNLERSFMPELKESAQAQSLKE